MPLLLHPLIEHTVFYGQCCVLFQEMKDHMSSPTALAMSDKKNRQVCVALYNYWTKILLNYLRVMVQYDGMHLSNM